MTAVALDIVTGFLECSPLESRMAGTADCAPLKHVCSPEDVAETLCLGALGTSILTKQSLVVDRSFTLADLRHFKN